MAIVNRFLDPLSDWIAARLETTSSGYEPFTPSDPTTLSRILTPGDILLVEGNQKISSAIKYLTQSTWSHAAIYVGEALYNGNGYSHEEPVTTAIDPKFNEGQLCLIEVELGLGCIAVPLSKYETYNTRICRPLNLTPEDRATVINFMIDKLGIKYDTRNILDLARYLFPTPPIPVRWRRRMLQLGSGEPTRAICSTLIAQAFQNVQYPILPRIERVKGQKRSTSAYSRREILHIRHHSLFAPRDFDISPYFAVIKPTIEYGFDYKRVNWAPSQESKKETKIPDEEGKATS
jgi:hypothetical protein